MIKAIGLRDAVIRASYEWCMIRPEQHFDGFGLHGRGDSRAQTQTLYPLQPRRLGWESTTVSMWRSDAEYETFSRHKK